MQDGGVEIRWSSPDAEVPTNSSPRRSYAIFKALLQSGDKVAYGGRSICQLLPLVSVERVNGAADPSDYRERKIVREVQRSTDLRNR